MIRRHALLLFAAAALLAARMPATVEGERATRPSFQGSISRIGPELRDRMTSWHRGCPVHLRDLRLVRVTTWGFDHRAHRGRLIVLEDHAKPIRHVMRVLYRRKYPIRHMRLIDAYGSDDRRSMAADNTSAFNCRFVAGTRRWSMHAYGLAIDVNPVENPYVAGGHVSPPAGRRYVDRSTRAPGVIHSHGFVVRAFRRIGWEWGGNWSYPKDYQHFSATGT
jgi:poly-gamma-glutamate synthesis protein (capsule biosynthesis protein)